MCAVEDAEGTKESKIARSGTSGGGPPVRSKKVECALSETRDESDQREDSRVITRNVNNVGCSSNVVTLGLVHHHGGDVLANINLPKAMPRENTSSRLRSRELVKRKGQRRPKQPFDKSLH